MNALPFIQGNQKFESTSRLGLICEVLLNYIYSSILNIINYYIIIIILYNIWHDTMKFVYMNGHCSTAVVRSTISLNFNEFYKLLKFQRSPLYHSLYSSIYQLDPKNSSTISDWVVFGILIFETDKTGKIVELNPKIKEIFENKSSVNLRLFIGRRFWLLRSIRLL